MRTGLLSILLGIHLFAAAQGSINWDMGINLASSSSGNEHPRIMLDRTGNPMVVWHHASRCMFSKWNGSAFTTPVMLNPMNMTVAGASWMGPDIASQGDTVYVVFKQTPEASDTSNIFCVHSYDGGMNFSSPVQVDNIADSISRFPTVTTDANGNPLVAFMKFDAMFGDSRWVVAKSTDYGNSFSIDTKASGWGGSAAVCDCCPGALISSGNICALLYRNNNNNIRDSWVGISTDNASSFTGGFNADNNNWMLMSCPSSGPDGVIIGDTLYSVFMNGGSGNYRTYFSKSSISSGAANVVSNMTGAITGLSQQNYPRIASDGKAMAMVWKQTVSGAAQLPIRFTNNIADGFPAAYDTVDLGDITNADVALANGKIFVVWEDDNTGTIKYRTGTYPLAVVYASVQVNITPAAAVTAGATWNVDGGAPQQSGATVNNLIPGNHTINYNTVSGWITPAPQVLNLTSDSTTVINAVYTAVTGVNDLPDNGFSIYPNPANDVLHISSTGNEKFTLNIFNAVGEKIYNTTASANCELSTVNFPKGIYVVQLKTEQGTMMKKIVHP